MQKVIAVSGVVAIVLGPLATTAGATFLTPSNVTASSWWDVSVHPDNLINSSGLSENTASGTHDNDGLAARQWFAGLGQGTQGGAPSVAAQELVFDLGQAYDLTQAYIWQMNQGHAVNGTGQRNTRTLDF